MSEKIKRADSYLKDRRFDEAYANYENIFQNFDEGRYDYGVRNFLFASISIGARVYGSAADLVKKEDFEKMVDLFYAHKDIFTSKQQSYLEAIKNKEFAVIGEGHVDVDLSDSRRYRFAETVLAKRTSRFTVIIEQSNDVGNQAAILRTAECLGIQNVWLVNTELNGNVFARKSISKGTDAFLSIQRIHSSEECVQKLKAENKIIWATDLSDESVPLEEIDEIPENVAVVFGNEKNGCSEEVLAAADKRIYIPINGFAQSLNVGVAAAIIMKELLNKCPEAVGDLTTEEKQKLRKIWFEKLGASPSQIQSLLENPPPPLESLRERIRRI
eukprot:TRINITY_DN5678_c0_g1_i1.p1 TRINITY_DN5678_c0_g1~~TRINITY_DN5678_c0_g1_i1.p1  ORF type:complete len:382 (-),score=88.35 TRINITY_DN5678_c0_g1_i1:850-1836(-)